VNFLRISHGPGLDWSWSARMLSVSPL